MEARGFASTETEWKGKWPAFWVHCLCCCDGRADEDGMSSNLQVWIRHVIFIRGYKVPMILGRD